MNGYRSWWLYWENAIREANRRTLRTGRRRKVKRRPHAVTMSWGWGAEEAGPS